MLLLLREAAASYSREQLRRYAKHMLQGYDVAQHKLVIELDAVVAVNCTCTARAFKIN